MGIVGYIFWIMKAMAELGNKMLSFWCIILSENWPYRFKFTNGRDWERNSISQFQFYVMELIFLNFKWTYAGHFRSNRPIFTTLLLDHSHSAYLFGMFFRYQWRYLCFLPTLSPSCCLVGIKDPPSWILRHTRWWSFYSGKDARACNVIGEREGYHTAYI